MICNNAKEYNIQIENSDLNQVDSKNLSNGHSKNNDINSNGKQIILTSNLPVATVLPSTLHNFRSWSFNAFKYAKQFISEHLTQGPRTTDIGLENRVAVLNSTQSQLANLLKNINQLLVSYQNILNVQNQLAEAFLELAPKSSDSLRREFLINADIQKALVKNENHLLSSLKLFHYNFSNLTHITIEDALSTVKLYESARLKFDAHRLHLDELRKLPKGQMNMLKLQTSEQTFNQHKVTFERLHHDLNIKLQFLEDNKIVVCQKNLKLLNMAFFNYINSSNDDINEIIKAHPMVCTSQDYAPL